MAKKDDVVGPAVVRAVANADGSVSLVHGNVLPQEDEEAGFKEGASWVVTPEVARDLADALPNVVQEALATAHALADAQA